MSLHLYDTSSRTLRPFTPIKSGEVSMYLCGATVQSNPHVGHLRSGLVFDVLTRWLMKQNYKVTLKVPGIYNLENAVAAIAACTTVGVEILASIQAFTGPQYGWLQGTFRLFRRPVFPK